MPLQYDQIRVGAIYWLKGQDGGKVKVLEKTGIGAGTGTDYDDDTPLPGASDDDMAILVQKDAASGGNVISVKAPNLEELSDKQDQVS